MKTEKYSWKKVILPFVGLTCLFFLFIGVIMFIANLKGGVR